MSSTFFGLTIGYNGLTTYQAALETTGNNISNVETEGYTRQRVNQKAARALETHTKYGMAGSGSEVVAIEQVRNAYYDIKFRNATANLGEYETKATYMKQIENYFNDDGETVQGFSTRYDALYAALEDLQNNPSSTAARTAYVGQAQSFTEYFNSLYENLQHAQTDANDEIKTAVSQINTLASQIATLNKQINMVELTGTAVANELRDQRNLLVDELSKYVDVTIYEDPIYADADQTIETGATRYIVSISGNQTLVQGYEFRTLECTARDLGDKVNQADIEGLYDITWSDTDMRYYPCADIYSGSLSALLQVRDGNNSEFFTGIIDSYTDTSVTVTCDAGYLQDMSKLTLNGSGTINLSGTDFEFTGWTVTYNDDGTSTFVFDLKEDQPTARIATCVGGKAAVGTSIDYKGVPYYMEQMNEWVRKFAECFNNISEQGNDLNGNSMVGDYDNGVSPTAFFTAKNVTDRQADYNFIEQSYQLLSEGRKGVYSSTSDCYYQLTGETFLVNTDIINNVSLIGTTASQGDINKDANDILKKLEEIRTDKSVMSFRGCSSGEFLQCVLGDVALAAYSANNFESNFANIQGSVTNQRLSVSGVDDDEEALNLVKYQNAYNLSAKMIQVMTEIYDRLILNTGV